jgi:uncharacterized membrane-anchored protein
MRQLVRALSIAILATCGAALAQDAEPKQAVAPDDAAVAEASAEPEAPALPWQAGPLKAPIGSALAEIDLPEGYLFLDRDGTLELLRMTGNLTGESELAALAKADEGSNWFVIFEWDDSGWVDDSDRADLDADALLADLQENEKAANEQRKEMGLPTLELVGWQEPPHYDNQTNNLTWATQAKSVEGLVVNRLVKLLGRRGVMTATLVAGPEELPAATAEVDQLLAQYRFLPGSTYAEYLPGTDKAAGYGLGALVVGGVLAKSGFLAKFWKLIAAGAVAAVAGIRRLFGGKQAETPSA